MQYVTNSNVFLSIVVGVNMIKNHVAKIRLSEDSTK